MTPRNPLREKLLEASSRSGFIEEGFDEMVASYEESLGLNQPLWKQYVTYMGDILRGDLGYSISNFPAESDRHDRRSRCRGPSGLLATTTDRLLSWAPFGRANGVAQVVRI